MKTVRTIFPPALLLFGSLLLPAQSAEKGNVNHGEATKPPAQHKPEFLSGKITIAKETTRILGPLDKEGHVDYAAAINAECSRGVTPENNAVVKLFEAVGPSEIAAENRNRYFQLLGISPLPVQGPYAISVPEFAKVHGEKGTSPWDAWLAKNFDPATQRPWAAEEFPFVAAWLKANEIPLAKIHDAAGRSRYYGPWVKASPDDPLTMVRFPAAGCLRQCRDLLIARSMLRLHAGQVQDAWADILACHRLARVCGQGPSLVHQIVARNLNGVACQATGVLAREGKLTPDQAARCLNDLDALPPLPRTRDGLDLAERYVFLDVASHVARGGPAEIERCVLIPSQIARGEAKSPARGKELPSQWVQNETVDWDEVMHDGNRWYDLLVAAAEKPTWPERSNMSWTLEKKLKEELDHIAGGGVAWKVAEMNLFLGRIDREIHSLQMFEFMAGMLSPDVATGCFTECREEAHFQLARLSLALAAYQAQQGEYPARLEGLTPRILKDLPKDPFSGAAFCYQRQPKGYLVYSVGWNGKDDGGRDKDADPPGDDIAVRVPPLPPAKRVEKPAAVADTRRDELHDLIAALRDPDPRKRARAATALGELKGKAAEAVGPLIALLGDTAATNDFGPTTVSAAAAMALGEIGEPAVAPLIAALGNRSPMVRRMAVIALGGIEDRRVTAAVLERVKDEDAGVRGTAIAMLSGTDDPRAKEAVIGAISDRASLVRGEAARVLGRIRDPRVTKLLVTALDDKDRGVRLHAVMSLTQQAMGGVKELAAVKPLLATLKDEDPELRSTAAQALGEIADPRAVEGLIATLDDKWPNIQARAADSLGSLHDSRAVEPLLAVLRNSSRELRARTAAATALGAIGDRRATEALLAALKSSEQDLRRAAAGALGGTKDERAVLPLIAALRDEDWLMRATAADSLAELKDPRAVAALRSLLTDKDETVRSAAKKAIDAIAPAAKKKGK